MANEASHATALHDTLHGFYRDPDPERAILALSELLDGSDLDKPAALYTFARIAELSPPARRGFEQLRERNPPYVDRVLQGSGAPGFPRVHASELGGDDLDLLWAEFFVTGEAAPVLRIISVLDGKDVVRERLAQWLREQTGVLGQRKIASYQPMFVRCMFPIDYEKRSIARGVDLDVHVAMSARAGKLQFDELPVKLLNHELVRLAVKSAAVWSLRSIATEHDRVAEICAAEATRPGGSARQLLAPSP